MFTKVKPSSQGMKKVSCNLIKSVRDIVFQPLTEFMNCSFERRSFPKCLKYVCSTPIFKGGDRLQLNKYRPISVIPIGGEIVEKCMFTIISKKFDRHSILSSDRFGFNRGKSCVGALNSRNDFIYENVE